MTAPAGRCRHCWAEWKPANGVSEHDYEAFLAWQNSGHDCPDRPKTARVAPQVTRGRSGRFVDDDGSGWAAVS